MGHLPLVTGVLLAALVFVPLWLRQRTEHLRERVTDVALPTRNALLEVQNAFASELAAIRGYELTGDERFLNDFRAAAEKDRLVTARLLRHDLKNPLHTIGMVMDLLATEPLREEERQEQLRIVVRTLDRMNRLIHDLLDAARVPFSPGRNARARQPLGGRRWFSR